MKLCSKLEMALAFDSISLLTAPHIQLSLSKHAIWFFLMRFVCSVGILLPKLETIFTFRCLVSLLNLTFTLNSSILCAFLSFMCGMTTEYEHLARFLQRQHPISLKINIGKILEKTHEIENFQFFSITACSFSRLATSSPQKDQLNAYSKLHVT